MPSPKDILRKGRAAATSVVGSDPTLVDLIHAIKNEIMGQLREVEEATKRSATTESEERAIQSMQIRTAIDFVQQLRTEHQALRDETYAMRQALSGELRTLVPALKLADLRNAEARLSDIDAEVAYFLNYASSHKGPLRDANLWINNPVIMEWQAGAATIGAVNERIVEVPYVLQALASAPSDGAVLDIGGGESTVGFSLASLGYRTTIIEPQGYPFTHPNLEVLTHPLEQLDPERRFDAVLLLSTIEHFGIGHYAGGPEPDMDADRKAVTQISGLLSEGGFLVLTTPYGPASVNDLERTYDRPGIARLLEGWEIQEVKVCKRKDRTTWVKIADELIDVREQGHVVMLEAKPA